jgi:membrane protease YdiL (CAAX protease family)
MKKALYATQIFFLLLFFVVPPLFNSPDFAESPLVIKTTFFSFFLTFVAALFLYLDRSLYQKNYKDSPQPGIFIKHAYALCSFGLLILVSVIFQIIFFVLSRKGMNLPGSTAAFDIYRPVNALEWLSLFTALLTAVFTEEVCYRFILCDVFKELTGISNKLLTEIPAVILFALGHIYEGFAGVLNALVCGIILRLLFVKSKTLLINIIVHFFYNLLYLTLFLAAI